MRQIASPLRLVVPRRHRDARGWFTETYNRDTFAALGIASVFVQSSHSLSTQPFTVRGLHFQAPPRVQEKLIRCIRGRIFDVAVDIREGSPTYGRWAGTELSAEGGEQLFVPAGFAHGFMTLEADCEVTYACSDTYAPAAEGGLRWDDSAIGIRWPLPPGAEPVLSPKDREQPLLKDLSSGFGYDGHPLVPPA
jgi:dTDP-4-dehydrorhamnose 3,5-epimerase